MVSMKRALGAQNVTGSSTTEEAQPINSHCLKPQILGSHSRYFTKLLRALEDGFMQLLLGLPKKVGKLAEDGSCPCRFWHVEPNESSPSMNAGKHGIPLGPWQWKRPFKKCLN
jgi:hypothetical protein